MNPFEPVSVDVSAERLKIDWSDGRSHELPARLLRAACNCAACVSEITGKRLIETDKIPPDIKITGAEPTGNYAVSIVFSDGHRTGIFTYQYLRELGEKCRGVVVS